MRLYFSFFIFLFSSLLFSSSNLYALPSVIYDDNNIVDRLAHQNVDYKEVAKSTVAMFQKRDFKETDEGLIFAPKKKVQTIGEIFGLCPDEEYYHEPAGSGCSGTLVGSDLILTASHCLVASLTCEEYVFVFDYMYTEENLGKNKQSSKDEVLKFSSSQVYKCKEVLDRKYEFWEGPIDYALVRLDRPVLDRSPIPYRKEGVLSLDSSVFVVGHPLGMPSKISDEAYVMGRETPYDFQANLDAFPGNSGSGVFNAKTLELEGILHGLTQDDFTSFPHESCKRLNKRRTSDNSFFFSIVSKVGNVDYLKNLP